MSLNQARIVRTDKSIFEKEKIGLGEFFFRQANKYQDKIFQIDATTGQQETYSSINEKCIRLAVHLKRLGICPEDVVISCLDHRAENIIPQIGTLYIGAKICALHPAQSQLEYQHCLNITKPKIIFSEPKCLETIIKASNALEQKPIIVVVGEAQDRITLTDLQTELPEAKDFRPTHCQNSNECAILFFSSGTTGLSKAICFSHHGLINGSKNLAEMDHFDANAVLYYTPFYWMSGMLLLSITYHVGGSRIIPEVPFSVKTLLQTIEKYKITHVFLTSTLAYNILEVANDQHYDISSVYSIDFAGGIIPIEKMQKIRNFFGMERITTLYGLTEGGASAVVYDYTRDQNGLNKMGSSGRGVKDLEIKIVDLDTRQLLGPYQKGELLMKSPYLTIGYYNTDSSPSFDKDGFLKTGDVAYYDEDNYIYVADRIKEVFKYRSFSILPSFLESILLEHIAVKEAAVFAIPHDQDRNHPAAVVTLKNGCSADENDILAFFSDKVSDYHKLRGGLKIIDHFDKTPSGKLHKKRIVEMYLKLDR